MLGKGSRFDFVRLPRNRHSFLPSLTQTTTPRFLPLNQACNIRWLGLRKDDIEQLVLEESLLPLKPRDLKIAKSLESSEILQASSSSAFQIPGFWKERVKFWNQGSGR